MPDTAPPPGTASAPAPSTPPSSLASTLLLLSLCALASAAAMRLCDPLLPALANTFDRPLTAVAGTITAFGLAYGCAQMLFGPLGDRVGKLRVIGLATLGAAAGSAAGALAQSLEWLIVTRVVTGAFAAAVIPLSMAWIGDQVPFSERQPVLARYLIGQMLGVSAGQLGAGLLADWVGWRAAFWMVCILFLFGGLRLLAQRPARPNRLAAPTPYLLQARSILAKRWAWVVLATTAAEGFLLFGAMALVATFLQESFQVRTSWSAAAAAVFGLGGIAYALQARALLRRLNSSGLAIGGGGLFALAMAILVWQPVWWPAFAASLLAGTGYYMLHNTLQTQATQLSTTARGMAIGLFATGLWLGQGVGVTLAAWAATQWGFRWVFGVSGVLIGLLGLAFGLAAHRQQQQAG